MARPTVDDSSRNLLSLGASSDLVEDSFLDPIGQNASNLVALELLRQYRVTAESLIFEELPRAGRFARIIKEIDGHIVFDTTNRSLQTNGTQNAGAHQTTTATNVEMFLKNVRALSVLSREDNMVNLTLKALVELDTDFQSRSTTGDEGTSATDLCVDFVIGWTIVEILRSNPQHLERKNKLSGVFNYVAEHYAEKLRSIVKLTAPDDVEAENRLAVTSLISRIFGLLSTIALETLFDALQLTGALPTSSRLAVPLPKSSRHIVSAVKKAKPAPLFSRGRVRREADDVLVDVLRSLHLVRLDLQHGMTNAVRFFNMIQSECDKKPTIEIRVELSDLVAAVVYSTLEDGRLSRDGTFKVDEQWDGVVKPLFDRFTKWTAKQKVIAQTYPGYTAMFCMQRDGFFNSLFPTILKEAINNCSLKSKPARLAALQCIKILVQALYSKKSLAANSFDDDDYMKIVANSLSAGPIADEATTGLLVDILNVFTHSVIASDRDDEEKFQIARQQPIRIFKMLFTRNDDTLLIALRSCLYMFEMIRAENSKTPLDYGRVYVAAEEPQHFWTSTFASQLVRLMGELSPHLKRILVALNSEIGMKDMDDHALAEKDKKVKQFVRALKCWELALEFLADDTIGQFGLSLVDELHPIPLTVHASRDVQVQAKSIVEILLRRYESRRSTFLIGIVELAKNVPHQNVGLKINILIWLSRLIEMWAELVKVNKAHGGKPERPGDFTDFRNQLEARVIFFLCYNDVHLRRLSCQLAGKLNELCRALQTSSSDFSAYEIVYPLFEKWVGNQDVDLMNNLSAKLQEATFAKVDPGSVAYACPQALILSWNLIVSELLELVNAQKKAAVIGELEDLWFNLLTVAFAIAAVENPRNKNGVNRQRAVELVRAQIGLWLGGNEEVAKNRAQRRGGIAVKGVKFVHPFLSEILLKEVFTMVEEPLRGAGGADIFQLRRGKRRKDLLRFQIEYIYRSVAYVIIFRSSLRDYATVLVMVITHIRDTLRDLQRLADDTSDDIMVLREHFCKLVSFVARDLYYSPEGKKQRGLDMDLRSTLFSLFAQWNGVTTAGSRYTGPSRVLYSDEVRRHRWEKALVEAASSTLMGPSFETGQEHLSFQWARHVFQTMSAEFFETVREGLKAMCESDPKYLGVLIDHCYSSSSTPRRNRSLSTDSFGAQRASASFFSVLHAVLTEFTVTESGNSTSTVIPLHTDPKLFTVTLWTLSISESNPKSAETHQKALEALQHLVKIWFSKDFDRRAFKAMVCGRLLETNEKLQSGISDYFCKRVPGLSAAVLTEMTTRINQCEPRSNHLWSFVQQMIPWVRTLRDDHPASRGTLSRMLKLTLRFRDDSAQVFEELWFATGAANIETALSVLVEETMITLGRSPSIRTPSPDYEASADIDRTLAVYRGVAVCCSRARPRDTVAFLSREIAGDPVAPGTVEPFANLKPWDSGNLRTVRRSDAAIVLLSEVAYETDEELREYIPVILHEAMIGLEKEVIHLVDGCINTVINIVHSLSILHSERLPSREKVEEIRNAFEVVIQRTFGNTKVQEHPGDGLGGEDSGHFAMPREIRELVRWLIMSLEDVEDHIRERWAFHAIDKAVVSEDYRTALRSLQIYRDLELGMEARVCRQLIQGVHTCLREKSPHMTKFGRHIMSLLARVFSTLPSNYLHIFPYLYWACIALDGCGDESLEQSACSIMLDFFSPTQDLSAYVTTISVILATIPPAWEPWLGIYRHILDSGLLYSPACATEATMLMTLSVTLQPAAPRAQFAAKMDTKSLLHIIAALLPWMCAHLTGDFQESRARWEEVYMAFRLAHRTRYENGTLERGGSRDLPDPGKLSPPAMLAACLALACEELKDERLEKLIDMLQLYTRNYEQMTEEHFYRRIRNVLPVVFFPEQAYDFFVQMFSVLKSGAPAFHEVVFKILAVSLPMLDEKSARRLSSPENEPLLKSVVDAVVGSNSEHAVMVLDKLLPKLSGQTVDKLQIVDILRSYENVNDSPLRIEVAVTKLTEVLVEQASVFGDDAVSTEGRYERIVRSLPYEQWRRKGQEVIQTTSGGADGQQNPAQLSQSPRAQSRSDAGLWNDSDYPDQSWDRNELDVGSSTTAVRSTETELIGSHGISSLTLL